MSIINTIGCRECDSPDCSGCNIYTLACALAKGILNWAKDEHNSIDEEMLAAPNKEPTELFPDRSKCVRLDLEPGDLRNIVELFEDQFFEHLKFLLDEGELDNIDYLRSMLRIYDQLCAAQAKEEA